MTMIKSLTNIEYWLHEDWSEFIEDILDQEKKFYSGEPNTQESYTDTVRVLVQQLKQDLLGETVFVIIKATEQPTNKSRWNIEATVMRIGVNGNYEPCPHPLHLNQDWIVYANLSKTQIKIPLNSDNLFEVEYEAQKNKIQMKNLLNIKFDTAIAIKENFSSKLMRLENKMLARTAQELFETDLEKWVLSKFDEYFDTIGKDYEKSYSELENLRLLLNEEIAIHQRQEQDLNEKQLRWKRILENIERHIRFEEDDDETEVRTEYEWIPEKSVEMLQSLLFHNSEDELIYEEATIEMFLRALQTNTLIVLSGPSGTGKSSLVAQMARAIKGSKASIIPVQSGWTDTQDLLGYFNPIDRAFIATPFMEAIVAAARPDQQDYLHLICLDEMNLSHVEHYFSEFLSIREQKDAYIHLYNKRFYEQAKEIVEGEHGGWTSDQLFSARELIGSYPYRFKIPPNVRFIGTINMDHTVKSLSPKVIDRSFVIELDHLEASLKMDILKNVNKQRFEGCLNMKLDQFVSALQDEENLSAEAAALVELSQQLSEIPNAPLNSRGQKHIEQYLSRIPKPKSENVKTIALNKAHDQLILTKILPRLESSSRNVSAMDSLARFQQYIEPNYPRSAKKLSRMMENERIVRFW